MVLYVPVVIGLVEAVIVPVDKRNVLRHLFEQFFVDGARAVISAEQQLKEHIAPHHRTQAVFSAQFRDASEVSEHDIETVLETVKAQIFPKPHHFGLVHTDIYSVRRIHAAYRAEHVVYELVCFILAREQYVAAIGHAAKIVPAQRGVQVGESLYAGNEFYAEQARVPVAAAYLFSGKTPAHISEIRPLRHLVGVLRIKIHRILSHQGQHPYPALYRRRTHNGVARVIEESTDAVVGWCFPRFKATGVFRPGAFLRGVKRLFKNAQRPEKLDFTRILYSAAAVP